MGFLILLDTRDEYTGIFCHMGFSSLGENVMSEARTVLWQKIIDRGQRMPNMKVC